MHTSPVFGARLAINILSTLAYLMTLSQLFDKYMTSSQVWHTLTAMPQYAQLNKLRSSIGYSYSIEKKMAEKQSANLESTVQLFELKMNTS